jgi:hypothetical protein
VFFPISVSHCVWVFSSQNGKKKGYGTAWGTRREYEGVVSITMDFPKSCVTGINIYLVNRPDAVTKVEVRPTTSSNWQNIHSATPTDRGDRSFTHVVPISTPITVAQVKMTQDVSKVREYNNVDSVELIGTPGECTTAAPTPNPSIEKKFA